MEMQRVPKFGVCKTRAERERSASKTKIPQIYVPLRAKPKLFFSDEERARYERERSEKREKTRINLRRLRLSRALLYSLIFLNQATVVVLLLVSFSLGSGTIWEALFQIPSWLSLILIALYFAHRMKYRMFQQIRLRNFVVYTTLFAFALSTATLFTLRIQNGLMCRDFSGIGLMPRSCRIPQFLVAISWVNVALATIGNAVNYYFARLGRPEEQVPQPLHDPFKDCDIPRSPPPSVKKPRRQLQESELPPSFITNVRYGHRINDSGLYPRLQLLYREFVGRVEEAKAGGRQFPVQEELDMWYKYLYPVSEPENVRYLNYYEDMPPPRKVEEVELRAGWVDIPLYADDE